MRSDAEHPSLPALLERYERPLIRYAQSILGDLDTARDVVQDTFIRWVHRQEESAGKDGDHVSRAADPTAAWLFTVCRNRALDHQRKHSRIVPMDTPDDRAADEPSPA